MEFAWRWLVTPRLIGAHSDRITMCKPRTMSAWLSDFQPEQLVRKRKPYEEAFSASEEACAHSLSPLPLNPPSSED